MDFKRIKGEIKSPLRYPGGKTRAIEKILPLVPEFKEFREPFVGGGSVFIALKQRLPPNIPFKINDLNNDLYCFWKILRDLPEELIELVKRKRTTFSNRDEFFEKIHDKECTTDLERAVRFFIINRSTFSGLSDSGGFSQQAFEKRFTPSSIERLTTLKPLMKSVQIYNKDYEDILLEDGQDVFIFLDPPYLKATKKRLYGKDGDLHLAFDHTRFAENMQKCKHKWLITYDDTPTIRALFHFAHIFEWELQYGMNNYLQGKAEKGKELFICNYLIEKKIEKIKDSSRGSSLDKFFKPSKAQG